MTITKGLDFVEYLATPGLSNSQLNHLRKSPAHFQYYLRMHRKQSEAMLIGEAVHCRALQPELFEERYAVRPDVDRRTKAGKEIAEKFEDENPGKIILSYDQHKTVWNTTEFLRMSERFNALTSGCDREVSAFWNEDGIECKGRFDFLNYNLQLIGDIKTCKDCRRFPFERSIQQYGYYRQGAFYLRAARANGIKVQHFVIIAIETDPPHAFKFYRLRDDIIDLGNKEIEGLLSTYRECLASDRWPGYSDEIDDVGIPEWAKKEIGVEEENDDE